jgi:3-methyladenine DNA glycosylase AlkD
VLAAAVRDALARREDPAKAARMQAYMKSAMPFRGVDAAGQRDVARDALAVHPPRTRDEWLSAILALWRDARYREERYLAIALARRARYRTFRTGALLPVWEEFIVDGAWWDYVDPIATHLVGEVVCAEPEVAAPVVRGWSAAENMWLRRAAIISQLLARERTDLELLFACIEPNLSDPEFFVRKRSGGRCASCRRPIRKRPFATWRRMR